MRNLIRFYEARELVGFDRFLHVQAWLDHGLARPAVQRGLQVTAASSKACCTPENNTSAMDLGWLIIHSSPFRTPGRLTP